MTTPFRYEPNILSNPGTHYGTWTPDGWRVHEKRWAPTEPVAVLLSGDGQRTQFALPADFVEDVHDKADPHTDGGIYPAEPRVEYPVGRPRWAISHTYLAYPFADKTLYEQEYVWDRAQRTLNTFFREHVVAEAARTDDRDGLTVRVNHRPISQVVAGNQAYPLNNSAVRGVWASPDKRGPNYYTRQRLMVLPSANSVYIRAPHAPVVNCFGLWKTRPGDPAVADRAAWEAAGVSLCAPGLTAFGYRLRRQFSRFYNADLELLADDEVVVDGSALARLQAARDIPFREHQVGYAGWGNWDHVAQIEGNRGHYCVTFDFNHNGVVDADDEATLRAHLGRRYRVNYYSGAYYGHDWLSAGISFNAEMQGGEPILCAWEQGAGYEAATGVIRLCDTPGPNQPVFVEYHYDRPAAAGANNIRIVLRKTRT